jgi:hypothetical protein
VPAPIVEITWARGGSLAFADISALVDGSARRFDAASFDRAESRCQANQM